MQDYEVDLPCKETNQDHHVMANKRYKNNIEHLAKQRTRQGQQFEPKIRNLSFSEQLDLHHIIEITNLDSGTPRKPQHTHKTPYINQRVNYG